MNHFIISRAFRNIRRIPGRSILTGVVLFVIISLVMIGLTVQSGTQASIIQARKALGNKVVLEADMIGYESTEDGQQSTILSGQADLTESEAAKLTSSNLIEKFDYIIYGFANANINAVSPGEDVSSIGTVDTGNSLQPNFRLVGNINLELMEDFSGGIKKLTDGRLFTKEEVKSASPVVVIDEKLAKINNLSIGSSITVKLLKNQVESAPLTLEVIGIYEDKGEEAPYYGFSMLLRGNTLHMPYTTLQKMVAGFPGYPVDYLSSAYYYLHDPIDFDQFKAEAKVLDVDLSHLSLDMSDKSFTKISAPMSKLINFTKTGVVATLITGAFIMVLLMTIIIRERKTEVGILRSLGASQAAVALQFITEALLICAVALCLGLVSGNALSQKVADSLLAKELAQVQSEAEYNTIISIDEIFNPNNVETVNYRINTSLSITQIAQLFAAGMLLCLFGSLTSTYWIMKYEPMKMLINRT